MKMSTLLAIQDQTSQTAVAATSQVQSNYLPSYSLLLEKGTVKLTLNTLNRHSAFSFNEQTCLKIKTRMVCCYHNSMFKATGRIFNPHPASPAFTLNEKNDPANFYLPDSLSYNRLTAFSATTGFKISVLKCHYPQHFKPFTQQLAAIDNLQALTYHPAA